MERFRPERDPRADSKEPDDQITLVVDTIIAYDDVFNDLNADPAAVKAAREGTEAALASLDDSQREIAEDLIEQVRFGRDHGFEPDTHPHFS